MTGLQGLVLESDQIIALLSLYKQTAFDLWLSSRDISRVGWLADWEATFCLRVGCTCGRLWTCVFTCYIYWFSSALLLLAALPSRTNQLLRVQTYSRSAYVICLFLSYWSSLYRSNRQLCEMWLKLHNIIFSNDLSSTCIKILHESFLNRWKLLSAQ